MVAPLLLLLLLLVLTQRFLSRLVHRRKLLGWLLLRRIALVVVHLVHLVLVVLRVLLLLGRIPLLAHGLLLRISLRLVVLLLRVLLLLRDLTSVHRLLLLGRVALLIALVLIPLLVMLLRVLVLVDVLSAVRGRSLLPRVLVHIWHVAVLLLLAPISDHLNHALCIAEALELLDEGLVDLRQMKFLLAVGQLLQLHKVAVRHLVRIFEELILLQIHLQCFSVGKIVDCLFELNELLHLLQTALHAAQALVDGLVDGEQVALLALAVVVALVALHGQVVPHASLAERDLVVHAEFVDHKVMLVAVQHTCRLLLHLLLRNLVSIAAVLIAHVLGMHVLMVAVCVLAICAVPVSWLIHVVTHLYLFTK